MGSLTWKRHNSIQNQNNRKVTYAFPSDLWFLNCKKSFKIPQYLRELELAKNWPCDEFFKPEFFKVLRGSIFLNTNYFNLIFDIPLLIFLFWCYEHPLKECSCKFKIDKIIYSKSWCRTAYYYVQMIILWILKGLKILRLTKNLLG